MGSVVARESATRFQIVGAVAAQSDPAVGRSLRSLNIAPADVIVSPPTDIVKAAEDCDVYISFTNPEAELTNLPALVAMRKPLVIGTTGFTEDQKGRFESIITPVPAVVSSNFSIGANYLLALAAFISNLPEDFDFSIIEAHHSLKTDSPSGTAKRLIDIISARRGYTSVVSGRSGLSKRTRHELEAFSVRAGGIPGIHLVLASGSHEFIKLEHNVFSRSAFAEGALLAARWVIGRRPGIYSMAQVLGMT